MMRLIKTTLERFVLLSIAAAVSAAFYYVGGLKGSASILLGVCFTIVGLWLFGLWKLAAFRPYELTVYVDFDALRNDLGLSKADKPLTPDRPAHDIFQFSAIGPTLFAHHRRYTFQTATELGLADRYARSDSEYRSIPAFLSRIPCSLRPVHFDNSENRDPHPTFYFRPGRDGFQFGIRVVPKWWSEHKKDLSTQVRDLPISYDGEIKLAVLPHGYIPEHVRRWDEPISLLYPFHWRQRHWKAKLAKSGWNLDDDHPTYLRHRYLEIRFSAL